jgi:DNA-binding NtrC family response regulator
MRRLLVGVRGEANEIVIDLKAENDSALIGRTPSIEDVGSAVRDIPSTPRPFVLEWPSVSANHLAAWSDACGITVMDVGSRYGSWLRLPPKIPVHVKTDDPVHVHLAEAGTDGSSLPSPCAAEWTDGGDYGPSVIATLRSWLADLSIPASIRFSPRARRNEQIDHAGRLPLASGGELVVIAEQTMDARWHVVLQRIWRFVQDENARFEREEATRAEGLILASPAIRRVHSQVIDAARRGSRVMLVGPSGAGKEGLARVFHRHTGRSGAFVPRNCAMFTREFVRAELFGAEAGAYTGAIRRIVGAVERADGGTLFLDELGEMPLDVQPMLLRFLDRGEFERLGDYGAARTADVRIVGATNRDLRESLARNEFRGDLWFRLSNEVIELPPLCERFEDVRAFLKNRALASGGNAFDLISPDAEAILRAHRWKGNFRELDSFAARLVTTATAPIDAATCRELLARGSLVPLPGSPMGGSRARDSRSGQTTTEPWTRLIDRAAVAFADDIGHDTPQSWDEVKEFIEKYFKPLLFVRLASATDPTSPDDAEARAFAQRLDVDRGTAIKQLQRYFERFVP